MKDKNTPPPWSVVVVVFDSRNRVLALSRHFNRKDIALPGGDCDPEKDGSPFQTAGRELHEETGLIPGSDCRELAVWKGDRGQDVHAIHIKTVRGNMRPSGEGKPFWSPIEALFGARCFYQEKARELLTPFLPSETVEEEEHEPA